MNVRPAIASDREALADMLHYALFVAEIDARVIGFAEVGMRSHVEGCDSVRPIGFLEGWFVKPAHRKNRSERS